MRRPTALRAIIAYKFFRGLLSLGSAVAVLAVVQSGLAPRVRTFASSVHDHAVSALRHPSLLRGAALLVNAAIVGWLLTHALLRRRPGRQAH